MTKPITLTIADLQQMTRKLCDRALGDNVIRARSGNVDLVITDLISIPSEGLLIIEVAQEKTEPVALSGPINGRS